MASVLAILFLAALFSGLAMVFQAAVSSGKRGRGPSGTATAAAAARDDPGNPPGKGTPLLAPVVKTEALNKKEIAVMTHMDPRWYGREDGYKGTTHQEAVGFCMSRGPARGEELGVRELCLPEAYCPNGPPRPDDPDPRPLVFKLNPSPSEQWAATALNPNSWILIGTIEGNQTCEMHDSLYGGAQPLWGLDGTRTELKQHVLCCKRGEKVPDPREGPPAPSNGACGNGGRVRFSIILVMVAMEGISSLMGAW